MEFVHQKQVQDVTVHRSREKGGDRNPVTLAVVWIFVVPEIPRLLQQPLQLQIPHLYMYIYIYIYLQKPHIDGI